MKTLNNILESLIKGNASTNGINKEFEVYKIVKGNPIRYVKINNIGEYKLLISKNKITGKHVKVIEENAEKALDNNSKVVLIRPSKEYGICWNTEWDYYFNKRNYTFEEKIKTTDFNIDYWEKNNWINV